jgi:tRNA dimethylallyltransferase
MNSDTSKKILVISGPTASGKSYLANELKNQRHAVIINADSMQVYKELPILSAQPNSQDDCDNYKLYSFLNFYENCSAGIWLKAADKIIKEAFESNKLPIIVGGTGLYLKALLEGIVNIPEVTNDVKKKVQEKFLEIGKEKFHEKLTVVDPVSAKKIHRNDAYRMQRAMEVYMQTGKSIASFKGSGSPYNAVHISIALDRKTLYQNCDLRFKKMLNIGAEEEVRSLLKKTKEQPGKYNVENTLGYRSLVSYFMDKISLEEAILEASQATRNYAKRQCTWYNNQFPNKILLSCTSTVHEIKKKFLKVVEQQISFT